MNPTDSPSPLAAPAPTQAPHHTPLLPEPLSVPAPSALAPLATLATHTAALAHLGLLGASGIARIAASTHATISRTPHPLAKGHMADAERAPLPYQLVSKGLLWLAAASRQWLALLPANTAQDGLFRSALNGVVGDALSAHGNPLAHAMSLRDEFGNAQSPEQWQAQSKRGTVLFIHGLCLSEREWQTTAHQGFVRELRELGYGVAWLRYNTGRPIYDNGHDLSALLTQLPASRHSLTLIGHSMGGLVIRAACHHASEQQLPWLNRLQHAAYLGTPHQGAPLERLGEGANRLLALSPYTQPFMQLGNVRSVGIQNLRHGRITAAHHEFSVTLTEKTRHLLLAGHLGSDAKRHWLGDGLVPVRSALGQHVAPEKSLQGGNITRTEFAQLNHMAMLGDARVYAALNEWMQP